MNINMFAGILHLNNQSANIETSYLSIYPSIFKQILVLLFIIKTDKMGGCQSSVDDTEIPIAQLSALENKFKFIEKHIFETPNDLNCKLETISSNGKITDFITKNQQNIKNVYQLIDIEKNLGQNGKFQDPEFKRKPQSIGPEPYPQQVCWQVPQKFFKGPYTIFQGKIEPLDIKQGRLGNCYLLSAISSISQYPFIVKRIFQATEVSSYGYYGVWLFIDGIWQCVVLDSYFPVYGGKPFFSRNNQNQLWVMLIQKAYAKIFGSYQAIESGLTGIALNSITGAPYEYLSKDSKSSIDIEQAWLFITQNISQNFLLTGSTQNNDRNEHMGLVSSHAYSILDVQEVHIAAKKGKIRERIIKMMNPWGKYQWKGRWSEYSDVWSQELRTQLKFQKADDGLFWINVQDFVENFGQICVCKYNKNYISTSISLKFSDAQQNGYKGVFIRTNNRTEGYISVIQKDHRYFAKNYSYSLVRLILLKIDKNTNNLCKYLNDFIDCDRDGTIKVQLDPGDYYAIIQMDWKCNFTRNVTLNFYGQHPINMSQDTKPLDIQRLFNQVVILHEKFTQKQRIYQYAKDNKIKRTTGSIAGYVYYHYTNQSTENNYLCETVSLKQKKFIQVYGQKQKQQFTVKIFPEEQRIVKLKVTKQGNSCYSFSTKIQFYIVEKYSLKKLRELADKKPTKLKKRQIEGKEIDVRVKTYNYSGGIVLLYQNKMDKYAYIQEITFQLENLELENQTLSKNYKLQIELDPQSEKMLSFLVTSPGKEIVFRTKMSFYLNAPEFKF